MTSKELPIVYISDELAQRTAAFLDSFARRRPSEGVVYWFGIEARGPPGGAHVRAPDGANGQNRSPPG